MLTIPISGVAAQERAASKRLALVIGEAAYPQARLPTANADAGLMATAFAQAGFAVTALADADAAQLRATTADFAAKARAAGPGVVLAVYVSGYGLQYDGENWLVPVGARIEVDTDVPQAAMRLAELSSPLEAVPATTRFFVFDVAREAPFARKGQPLAAGLALSDAPVGSIYAFNTAPGALAPVDVPPFGSYARALAEAMQAPGLALDEMLRRVRLRVGERTDGAAVPFDDGSGDPGFAFFPGAKPQATPLAAMAGSAPSAAYSTAIARDTLPGYVDFIAVSPHDPLVGRVRAMAAARREALFWSEAVRNNTPRAYWTYMRRYPRGSHRSDVRRQLFALHAALEPPPRFDIVAFEGLPPPPADEIALLEHLTFADADGPSIPAPPATLVPPARNAFFETLPLPPLAPSRSLALPLPVSMADDHGRSPGTIEEPATAAGALVTIMSGDGLASTTVKSDATVVSRLSTKVEHSVRTVDQKTAGGAVISNVTVTAGADGAVTMSQFGPSDRLIARTVSRDAVAGGRLVTLLDAAGQAVAATIVSREGIVTTNAALPGKALPPRFVLLATRDAQGGPMVAPEAEASQPVVVVSPSRTAPEPHVAKEEPTPGHEPKPASVTSDATKAPALPPAAGLTGQAPALDIPPPPPAPAFDAAAAPIAATPPAPEIPTAVVSAKRPPSPGSPPAEPTPLVATAPAVAAPSVAPLHVEQPPPAPVLLKPSSEPSGVQQPKAPVAAAHLPSEPPLPPRRAPTLETKAKPRGGR